MFYIPPVPSPIGIFGSLGGGKTLSAVEACLHFINNFHFVCTNILLLNLSDRQKKYYQYIDDISKVEWFKLPQGSPRGSGGSKRVAVVLDELPELLDQYTSGKDYWVKTFLSWLRMTSKQGQYVFIITQDPSFIMKPVRLLCAYWVKCEDMSEFRLPFIRIKLPMFRDFISRRTYNRDGTCINSSPNVVRKSVIGKYYRTAQGLSLYSTSNIPNEYNDPYSKFFLQENHYRKLAIFSSLHLVLIFCFILLFLLL